MSFSRITIFVVITAVAVYLGLNLILPHRKIEPTLTSGPTPDEVFNSSTSATPTAGDSSSTPAAASSEPGAASPASQPDAAAPAADVAAAQPASTGATSADAPAAADTASSEPAPTTDSTGAAAISSGDGKSLTEAEARKIAEDVGRKVATQVAQQLMQQQTAKQAATDAGAAPAVSDDEVRRIAQTEVQKAVDAKSGDAPVSHTIEAMPVAAPKQAAKLKPAHSAPAKTASAAASSIAAPAAKQSKAPQADAITAWWAPASHPGNGQLGLSFAGEAASERAIALLFTTPFSDAAAAGGQIKVLNASGKPVGGQWMLAPNPRMLVLRVATRGRYTIIVGADITDSQGRKLGTALHGPVYVH